MYSFKIITNSKPSSVKIFFSIFRNSLLPLSPVLPSLPTGPTPGSPLAPFSPIGPGGPGSPFSAKKQGHRDMRLTSIYQVFLSTWLVFLGLQK